MPLSKQLTMQDLLDQAKDEVKVIEPGETVEGEVVAITKNGIWLDLGVYGTGLVVGIEISDPTLRRDIKIGDKMSASVIEQEFDNGEVLLSLKKATKERSWDMLKRLKDTGETILVRPFEANKGGLMIEVDGVRGFLPVSQLTAEHYPRVTDKDEILIRLNQLIKKPMVVGVLDADKKENKVIFSEKIAKKDEIEKEIQKFKIGDKMKGRVTGIADFGVFLNIDGIEGMIHISEIAWDKVDDPSKYVKTGDIVNVVIIGIEGDRLSLSMKKLLEDPWVESVKQLKVGDSVKGEVTRFTPFGAFVRIQDNLEALVHISELSEDHVKDPSDIVAIGKKYDFKVLSIDIDNHRLALTLKEKKAVKKEEKPAKEVAKPEVVKKNKKEKLKSSSASSSAPNFTKASLGKKATDDKKATMDKSDSAKDTTDKNVIKKKTEKKEHDENK